MQFVEEGERERERKKMQGRERERKTETEKNSRIFLTTTIDGERQRGGDRGP